MIHSCQSCNAPLTTVFADLGRSPISNHFKTDTEIELAEETYPLRVFVCDQCKLVQLPATTIYPGKHFNENYAYFSSVSKAWVEHARQYAEMIKGRFNLNEFSRVIEIGGNDGYLLQHFVDTVPVLNVEPSANVAAVSHAKGIPTRVEFLTPVTAEKILEDYPSGADVIHCCNVLAHTPNIKGFVKGLATLLNRSGTITLEFPWLFSTIHGVQLDTIYHEHYTYLSLHALEPVLREAGLRVYDVEKLSTHGGSLRLFVCHETASLLESMEVARLMMDEMRHGVLQQKTYRDFNLSCQKTKRYFLERLIRWQNDGLRTVGYGAPAKITTLLNYCGVGRDFIEYVVEDAPAKMGKFVPGTAIPILHPEMLRADGNVDNVIIFPWNLKKEIAPKIKDALPNAKIWTPIPLMDQYIG